MGRGSIQEGRADVDDAPPIDDPPRVDYWLTPLGVSLREALCPVWVWVERHMTDVQIARREYDEVREPPVRSG